MGDGTGMRRREGRGQKGDQQHLPRCDVKGCLVIVLFFCSEEARGAGAVARWAKGLGCRVSVGCSP